MGKHKQRWELCFDCGMVTCIPSDKILRTDYKVENTWPKGKFTSPVNKCMEYYPNYSRNQRINPIALDSLLSHNSHIPLKAEHKKGNNLQLFFYSSTTRKYG